TGDEPAPLRTEAPGLPRPGERADGLRRRREGRVVLVYPNVGQQADDRPLGYGGELRLDQRSDLGLCLRDGEVERQRRRLVGGPLPPRTPRPAPAPASRRA